MANKAESKNREAVKSFIRQVKVMGFKEEDEALKKSLKEILETKGSTMGRKRQ